MESQEQRQAAPEEQHEAVDADMVEERGDEVGDVEERAEMSGADINDLPDSSFAYIEPGGEKDSEGKTVPRSKRHFPIHDAAHVRNALARAPQSPFGDKAMPKIRAAAKKFGIEVSQNSAKPPLARRRKERHRVVPLMPEVRHFRATGLEVRSRSDDDSIVVTGSPIIYNSPYTVVDMFGAFEERMRPGVAADVLLNNADVRFLFNHDGLPLARTLAGTLQLSDSPDALRFSARLDARQQLANDLAIAIERGDVSQMSCGFIVDRDEWDDDMEHREVVRFADLLDVSAVTYPASPTTDIEVARRMALEMPIESRARARKIYAEVRAGKVLSNSNQEKLVNALASLHGVLEGAGVDLSPVNGDDDGDAGADRVEVAAETGGEPSDTSEVFGEEPGEPIKHLTPRRLQLELELRKRRAQRH